VRGTKVAQRKANERQQFVAAPIVLQMKIARRNTCKHDDKHSAASKRIRRNSTAAMFRGLSFTFE